MSHLHVETGSSRHAGKLKGALALTAGYMVTEVIAGILTNSLALLADAGHMLTDVAGLALALFAISMAERPATQHHTYGFYRAEILAALANAVVLLGISGFVLYEAFRRFQHPPVVASVPMLVVAVIGLVINAGSIYLLRGASSQSLNLKGAYFEVLSDALSSVGVMLAALTMWLTGWAYADPLVSAAIGFFIVPRTWRLISDAVAVLLEGTPADVDIAEVRTKLAAIAGVSEIHDLHVWALTSGVNALSVHVVADHSAAANELLSRVTRCASGQLGISHVTVQVEPPGWDCGESHA